VKGSTRRIDQTNRVTFPEPWWFID